MVQSRNLTLAFSSESSVEEELKRESTADAITILVTSSFLLLILDCPKKYLICFCLRHDYDYGIMVLSERVLCHVFPKLIFSVCRCNLFNSSIVPYFIAG